LVPGQILEIPIGFVSNIKALPDISSDLCDNIALAPCVQFIPDLNIPTLYLANCTDPEQCYVTKDTGLLLALKFKAEQTLGIHRKIEDIFSGNQNDCSIINFTFLFF
jgi:hypothetical protein